MRTAGIIMAAGESRRLGRPKQLEPWQGSTLLRHAVTVARKAGCAEVIVVTGHKAAAMEASVADLACRCVRNPLWSKGMGGSIRVGIEALRASLPDAVLLMVCDQPLVTAEQLRSIIARAMEAESGVAGAFYEGTTGVPACFAWRHAEALSMLDLRYGAKPLLNRLEGVERVAVSEAALDVDVPGFQGKSDRGAKAD